MKPLLTKGRYTARIADHPDDLHAGQTLRSLAFGTDSLDCDTFDPMCVHVLVEETGSRTLVCCFRLLVLEGGADLARSYAAQY